MFLLILYPTFQKHFLLLLILSHPLYLVLLLLLLLLNHVLLLILFLKFPLHLIQFLILLHLYLLHTLLNPHLLYRILLIHYENLPELHNPLVISKIFIVNLYILVLPPPILHPMLLFILCHLLFHIQSCLLLIETLLFLLLPSQNLPHLPKLARILIGKQPCQLSFLHLQLTTLGLSLHCLLVSIILDVNGFTR